VALLDLVIYSQHVMFHAVSAFWRVHRMHHADLDFDVTTGARFHPIEIALSMLIKFGVVVALGALGVLIFEVLLNATSMFNHGNVRIPTGLDRYLRWLVVMPDMHRVHRSIVAGETNSNFGFNLPWWDRLLGTYRDQPAAGRDRLTLGIEQFRKARELWLDRMLCNPSAGLRAHTRSLGGAPHETTRSRLSSGSSHAPHRADQPRATRIRQLTEASSRKSILPANRETEPMTGAGAEVQRSHLSAIACDQGSWKYGA